MYAKLVPETVTLYNFHIKINLELLSIDHL